METNKKIKKILKEKVIFFDGAFGTYYYQLYNDNNCELANITSPKNVINIHKEYANAGANLLRANTFNANRYNQHMDITTSEAIIHKGFNIVDDVASKQINCYPCADIGPVLYDNHNGEYLDDIDILIEYKRIIDIFIDAGAEIFVFETMAEVTPLDKVIRYLKEKKKNSYIICQFAVRPDGYTKSAISVKNIVSNMNDTDCDVIGFNCASGPTHILAHVKKAIKLTNKPISALPNAGFPSLFEDREVYSAADKYFAQIMCEMISAGIKFAGGCCGTSPKHISSLVNRNKQKKIPTKIINKPSKNTESKATIAPDDIEIFVELTPPPTGNIKPLLKKCDSVESIGIKCITLPDSPLARPRMNPLIVSSAIRQQTNLNTLVHLCCRDRNIIALQSDIMASWALGLRNLLCVTGDAVAAGSRDDIKGVFNISSINLMKLVAQMNTEMFSDSPINIYAAVNLLAKNFEVVCKRSQKKVDAGAIGFLSQPIYSLEDIKKVKEFKQRIDAKLYVGIMPPVTYKNALFLKNEVPDINIPDSIIERLSTITDRNEAEKYGCDVVSNIALKSLQYADGLYVLPPFGRISCVNKIVDYLNKQPKRGK